MRAWGWQFQGDSFNREFRTGTRKLRARVGRYEGKWFLTSVTENPKSTGTISSPPFIIQKPYITFLISGGSSKKSLQANLIIDGKIVRTFQAGLDFKLDDEINREYIQNLVYELKQ